MSVCSIVKGWRHSSAGQADRSRNVVCPRSVIIHGYAGAHEIMRLQLAETLEEFSESVSAIRYHVQGNHPP